MRELFSESEDQQKEEEKLCEHQSVSTSKDKKQAK